MHMLREGHGSPKNGAWKPTDWTIEPMTSFGASLCLTRDCRRDPNILGAKLLDTLTPGDLEVALGLRSHYIPDLQCRVHSHFRNGQIPLTSYSFRTSGFNEVHFSTHCH